MEDRRPIRAQLRQVHFHPRLWLNFRQIYGFILRQHSAESRIEQTRTQTEIRFRSRLGATTGADPLAMPNFIPGMNLLIEELTFGLPDSREILRVSIKLIASSVLGGIIGLQREYAGKAAGLRTHMLVSLGATIFVMAPVQIGMSPSDLSRIIQGLATGSGFIGGGAILKGSNRRGVQGLTTAAGIWLTAGIGVAVGLGGVGLALLSAVLAWIILALLIKLELHIPKDEPPNSR
jgi:putative Mg2+ transporter-C (MgtC) family protein